MELEIGSIVEGKIRSIMNYGAFVSLPEGKSGLVHISEVSNTYVSDINAVLSVGQSVKVRILSAENGKINLSIKRAQEQPPVRKEARSAPLPKGPQSFEDKLKQFMSDSNSNLSSNKLYSDHKTKTRKR